MHCRILIGGGDQEYNNRLIENLVLSGENQFEMTIFNKKDNIEEYLNSNHYDLILLTEELMALAGDMIPKEMEDRMVLMLEGHTGFNLQGIQILFKYQSIKEIELTIKNLFMKLTTKERVGKNHGNLKLIGCYSPAGGSGNTTVAQIIAASKANQDYKVLFLSLESFPSYHLNYQSTSPDNLSDYMMHIMSKSNWIMGLEKMKSIDSVSGIHYLMPAVSEGDLSGFETNRWLTWIDYMIEKSDYDYLVIDFAQDFLGKTLELIKKCHCKVFSVRGDAKGYKKWLVFLEDLNRLNEEQILKDKLVIINQLLPKNIYERMEGDVTLNFDDSLIREMGEGRILFNSQSTTYEKIERLMRHV
jgi:cellulose biosynthesis protein BcsQ